MTQIETMIELSQCPLAILKFSAEWCQPCKTLASTLQEIDVPVLEIDVEEDPDMAAKFRVRNLPTLYFFKNGEQVDKRVGNISRTAIEEILKSI